MVAIVFHLLQVLHVIELRRRRTIGVTNAEVDIEEYKVFEILELQNTFLSI